MSDYPKSPRGPRRDRPTAPALDLSAVVLKSSEGAPLSPELFDRTAHEVAKSLGADERSNKPSQIRQFYDELVMWDERSSQNPEAFADFLPFIRMLNAKAAYAEGRRHVDHNFVKMIGHCLSQVDDPRTLRNFKLFFEAFLGYYKLVRPQG